MIIKLKTVEDALSTARQKLIQTRGYSIKKANGVASVSLLDYLPESYFGKKHQVNKVSKEGSETYYFIGTENWCVADMYVEQVIENKE